MTDVTKTIAVQALWDGTKLKSGTDEAETAIKGLEDQVSVSTESMESAFVELDSKADTTFATNLPNSADKGVTGLTTRASKFKGVGADLGTELSSGLASGASAPEQVASLGTSLSSLLALSAESVTGIVGAVGLGVGVALVKNMIDGAQARREAFVASINEMFDAIELTAKTRGRDIRRVLFDTFDFQSVVEDLGGEGGFAEGMRKINVLVDETGASFDDVVSILQGKMNPRLKGVVDLMAEAVTENDKFLGLQSDTVGRMQDENRIFKEIVKAGESAAAEQEQFRDFAQQATDHLRRNKDQQQEIAAAAERTADAWARAADSIGSAAAAAAAAVWDKS